MSRTSAHVVRTDAAQILTVSALADRKVLGPLGLPIPRINKNKLSETYTMTLACRIGQNPISFDLRKESNTGADFYVFIRNLVVTGWLRRDDWLIMDNWCGHSDRTFIHLTNDLLETFGIILVWLPKYSPELNPCELVFAQIKANLREWLTDENMKTFEEGILASSLTITTDNIVHYYRKCVYYPHDSTRVLKHIYQ